LIVEEHTSVINLKVGVSLGHGVLLHLITHWVTFKAKNSIYPTEAITCIPQINTHVVVEKEMEHKGEQKIVLVEP